MKVPPTVARLLGSSRVGAWVLAAATLAVGLHAALDPLWDADLWWILRAGYDLLATHSVPRTNGYSYTEPGHPWVMHEWLFGAVYALLDRAGGLGAIALIRVLAVPLTALALLARAARDARPGTAGLFVALALVVYGGRFGSPRPLGMVYPLAALTVAIALDREAGWRSAVALGAVSLVWTNAHGSFPLGVGIAMLGLGVPGGNRKARALGATLSALATLANPYGVRMHGLVARYALTRGADAVTLVHHRVLEWWPLTRAPWRVATPVELALASVLALVWLACLRDARWRPRAVLGLALTVMSVQHNRHLQLAGLLGVPLAAGPVDGWLGGAGGAPGTVRRMAVWLLPGFMVSLALWAGAMRSRSPGAWTDPTHDDEDLAALVNSLPPGARVFTSLPYTGYVLNLGRPVYWDSRNDCYGSAVLLEGFDLGDGLMDPALADHVLRARGTTDAVVPCVSRAARSLTAWRVTARRGTFCRYLPP